jgi:hypothetical protein
MKEFSGALAATVRAIPDVQQLMSRILTIAHPATTRGGSVVLLVVALAGCSGPTASNTASEVATSVPTPLPQTKDAFLRQLCTGLVEYEKRHRAWHAAHSELNDHHWDASFVPIVHDPLLPVFNNPPAGDAATVAALRKAFENASAKFKESADKWAAGDKQGAEAAESEAFTFLFGEFWQRLNDYGVTEQNCPL